MSDRSYSSDEFGFDNESVISDISENSESIAESLVEIYRYKVIYPGGTFVRVSPDLKADKTSIVLHSGDVFEASKSIVLDGVNYVKLADNSGWVFARHHDKEVLQLLDCVRMPVTNIISQTLEKKAMKKSQKIPSVDNKAKNNYWKEIRTRSIELKTFVEFQELTKTIKMHPALEAEGPARALQSREGDEKVVQICNLLCRITSVARQCSNVKVFPSSISAPATPDCIYVFCTFLPCSIPANDTQVSRL
jgi:hypothetical protein